MAQILDVSIPEEHREAIEKLCKESPEEFPSAKDLVGHLIGVGLKAYKQQADESESDFIAVSKSPVSAESFSQQVAAESLAESQAAHETEAPSDTKK